MRRLIVGIVVGVAALGPRPMLAQSVRELGGLSGPVTALAFSSNGEYLATAGDDSMVRIWRPDQGTLQWVTPKLAAAATALAFHPDGQALAVGDSVGRVEIWRLPPGNGPLLRNGFLVGNHLDGVSALTFTAGGKALYSCGLDNLVKVWDVAAAKGQLASPPVGALKHSIGPLANPPAALAVSPDGGWLAVADGQSVALYESTELKYQRSLSCPDGVVSSLAFSPDGRTLVAACGAGTVRTWSGPNFDLAGCLQGHSGPVRQLSFDFTGRLLCSVGRNGQVVIWDPATGAALFSHRFPSPAYCGALRPNGACVAVGTVRPTCYLLDLPRNVR